MRYRAARVAAIAAFVLPIALDCLCASASAHTKIEHARNGPHQVKPPAAHLIRCAIVFDGSPCWPDPGMVRPERRRWHVDPPLDQPPQFGPLR